MRARRQKAEQGFTMLEMLTVVAIVAVVAGLAAPQIGEALAENHTVKVQLSIVRLARQARARAAGLGRVHLLSFDPGGNSGQGQMEIWQGVGNRCDTTNWAVVGVGGAAADCFANPFCWDAVEPRMMRNGSNVYQILAAPAGTVQLCFEPDGRTLHRATNAQVWSANNVRADGADVTGAYVFSVARLVDGAQRGVRRRAIIPLGGDARVSR